MSREEILTDGAPGAIGPYSQAIVAGEMFYSSGQIGLDPRTGELVEGGFEAEARQVIANLEAVAKAARTKLANAVKLTVFVVDLADFPVLNAILEKALSKPYPARSTVEVSALPKGALVEIDMVATVK